uniref:Uncharacterized protein n=1 Tax=Meloidogyne floridensis TaxID=298350 RepID=A0A915P3R9_9BILA
LALQLILAKLDLLTINSTKQNFCANNVYLQEQGFCQDQTIIKQLQELNEKMSGNQKQQEEKIKYLELDKVEKEEEIKILKENLEENKNVYENKILKCEQPEIKDLAEDLEEIKILDKCNFTFREASHEENENTKELLSKDEQLQLEIQKKEMKILSLEMEVETQKQQEEKIKYLDWDKLEEEEEIKILKENLEALNELFKIRENSEELKEENEKILKELEENKLKIEKYEEDKKLELINLAKLKNENEGIFKVKNKLLEENKIKIMKTEEENKELNKKLKNSENQIYQLRQEIGEIYLEKSELEDELHNALTVAKYETEKNEELLEQIKEFNSEKTNISMENIFLLAEVRNKDVEIRAFKLQVKTLEGTINSLNTKIDELTTKLDQLNKENDKKIVFI